MPAKGVAIGAAWALLPWWLFALISIVLYLVPVFRPQALLAAFGVLIYLSAVLEAHPATAAYFGLIAFLIFGIKDLHLVDRATAYRSLVYLLLFGLFLDFFTDMPNLLAGGLVVRSVATALAFLLLAWPMTQGDRTSRIGLAAGTLFLWQWSWALLFLPLNHFAQTALQLLAAVIFLDLLDEYGKGTLERRKILARFTIFFIFFAVILAANTWRV